MQTSDAKIQRRYPIGAELIGPGQTHFRVWAPKAKQLDVVLESSLDDEAERTFHPLQPESGGYFSGAIDAGAGALYRLRVNEQETLYPDPASRWQPGGPHHASRVVDPRRFNWSDQAWKGLRMPGQVIYEMHLGTFTREGTWRAAAKELAELARIGITVIEMMPVADFPGEFGWGYDGVDLFAPCRLYGTPDDLRFFVNHAHSLGLGVILDVVYNHFGPEGNYLHAFSDDYIGNRHGNEWGDSLNFDGPESGSVREFFITNGRYWIEEFHFDGFRFDATHSITDSSSEYIISAVGRAAREAAGERSIILIAEDEAQEIQRLLPLGKGGDAMDGLWNDDMHHNAMVALTGRREGYYAPYYGRPDDLVSTAKYGSLFEGRPTPKGRARRALPGPAIPPEAFVCFLENHDQVANSAFGTRVRFLTSPGRYRAMMALLLLGPWTPMLFQGEEFGASSPFVYFADLSQDLREAIRKGRFKFLAQFASIAHEKIQSRLPDPCDAETFRRCKLDFSERQAHPQCYDLIRDLLALRRRDTRFSEQKMDGIDGAALNSESLVLRYFGDGDDDRLLLVNLGGSVSIEPSSVPLLSPPKGSRWELLWTSDSTRYGGSGAAQETQGEQWSVPAETSVALRAVPE